MFGQKLFVTGGSGYVGGTVIEFAIADGYTVTALSRTEASDAKLTELGATPVRGDLESLEVLTRESSKADVVISIADSLAGSFGKITMDDRISINNGAIAAMAAGLKGTGKPLVLTSGSLFAASDPDGKETDENSAAWPENHPFSWTSTATLPNLEYAKDGIRVCFCRLAPYVYGRGGSGVALIMGMWAPAGAGVYIDDGKARITTVHVEDAARLYLLLAKKGRAGESYNATWETHVTQGELAQAICKSIGVPCNTIPYEEAIRKMGDFFATFLAAENRASNKKAKEELGWEIEADKGILEEIVTGSYVPIAKSFRKDAS